MPFKRIGLMVVVLSLFILILSACAPAPAAQPTDEVTPEPTAEVTDEPTEAPPTEVVTEQPTEAPVEEPTAEGPQPAVIDYDGEPFVRIFRHGGMCINGSCDWTLVIFEDGHFVADGNFEGSDLEGDLSEEEMAALRAAIEATDFEAIQGTPFTEACPITYDGQETIYTFFGAEGEIELASCTVQIDVTAPLFALLDEIALKAMPVQE